MKKITLSTNYQLGRAHELNFKNGVAFDSKNDMYQVKSISQKGLIHFVTKNGKKLECDCVGYSFNKNCSHCVAVRVFQRSAKK